MHLRAAAAVLVALLLAAPRADAQGIVVTHSTEQTKTLDPASVQTLPRIEQHITMQTEHGTQQATFTGPLLWAVLQQQGAIDPNPRPHVRATILVTGRDGYTAVLALAEIDPNFEGKQVLLADARDGQKLPNGEQRLIVPGDEFGGRSVRDVVRIELR